MVSYTKEDFRRFREVCPSEMLFWEDENLAFEMEKRGWKPGAPAIYAGQKTADDLLIDRSEPFDPAKFIDKGWIIDEEDGRSLALVKIDPAAVQLEHMLKAGETRITGEEKFKRLKQAGHIRLDAKVFQTFWENQNLIPERWKEKTNGSMTYVFFDGTILWSPSGYRYVLCLCWRSVEWDRGCRWLERDWRDDFPSAVLAK